MKNLSLFVSAFALCASTSYAAIDCNTLPTCESLGYNDTVADCPGEVLKCPFDTTKGKCQRGPSVGDLKYSLKSSDHDGWLLCDGRQFSSDSTSKYFKLFQAIGTNFCHKYTSKDDSQETTTTPASNCSSGKFAVPDYRGFFLRGIPSYRAKNRSDAIAAPTDYYGYAADYMSGNLAYYAPWLAKKEQLPNIKGWFSQTALSPGASGAFSLGAKHQNGFGTRIYETAEINFNASSSNSIYKDNGHVIPAHYGAYIFIYAGR